MARLLNLSRRLLVLQSSMSRLDVVVTPSSTRIPLTASSRITTCRKAFIRRFCRYSLRCFGWLVAELRRGSRASLCQAASNT